MNTLEDALINLQCELVAERNRRNPQEISWLQYDILRLLSLESEIAPSKISVLLGISRTKLSKALKELKTMYYIQQKPNEKDGRELLTILTETGRQLLDDIDKGHQELQLVANAVFNSEEKEQLAQLAEKFSKALKSERLKAHE
ncbi:winged helix DNA-binding protein [Enterococcus sp. DIV0242_7C1]|uniref:HTH-type transcriptional regulator SarZ n=1 Tax=Candidatus Enterococcus dunnyi TaxID=1834192 RepID=A0A200JE64_9ENTE|nr:MULTISPECIES: winged helix DNA-binding protein [unclassified Enterococcus]MBO0470490.1 winged helix DNA-binding protein [Enterococcus sp. DIV0242_7C1]OUZ34857.1 hypothetical protein A5889_000332 [Enterococcus sp. 9D6_DIV0238]